jgi:hypothetical protein
VLVAVDGVCRTATARHGEGAAGSGVRPQSLARTTPGPLSVGKVCSKTAQRTLRVDEATRRAPGERADFEPIGPVVIKGKSAPVGVFSLALAQKV